MQLLIPFAAPLAEAVLQALPMLRLPNLQALLARAGEVRRDTGDAESWSPPHERALAIALGWEGGDGLLPWAARAAAADGLAAHAGAWALVTPSHWQVGSDRVCLADPDALELDDAASRRFADAVADLFTERGFGFFYGAPLRWYVVHPSLDGLRTASPDRAIGRSVDAWLGSDPAVRPVRRLQSEVQMRLHDHPLNDERETRRLPTVNSFWLSGCGVARAEGSGAVPQVHATLRRPALADDAAAWLAAWHALDATVVAAALQAAEAGTPVRITLCGERSAATFETREATAWRRLRAALRPTAPLQPLLESL